MAEIIDCRAAGLGLRSAIRFTALVRSAAISPAFVIDPDTD
jgi:hypothetical protein